MRRPGTFTWWILPYYFSVQIGHLSWRLNAALPALVFLTYYHIKLRSHFYLVITETQLNKTWSQSAEHIPQPLSGSKDNWSPGPAWHTRTFCSAPSILSVTNPQESYSFCSVIKEGQKTHPNAPQQVILKFIQICKVFWCKLTDYSAIYRFAQVATKTHQSVYNIPILSYINYSFLITCQKHHLFYSEKN